MEKLKRAVDLISETTLLTIKLLPAIISLSLTANQNRIEKIQSQIGTEIKNILQKRGGIFAKFGQLASHRYDLFPKAFCDQLLTLTDAIDPFDANITLSILSGEVPQLKLATFNPIPIGSASIAQVHKAQLTSGEIVAIKVQRPDLEQKVRNDLQFLGFLVKSIDLIGILPKLNHLFLEFSFWLKQELNFENEAKNLIAAKNKKLIDSPLRTNLPPFTNVPKVFDQYSTTRILVMEFIPGRTLASLELPICNLQSFSLGKEEVTMQDRKKTVLDLLGQFLKQFLFDGEFQADPHLSNLIYNQNKQIYFIDYGLVGKISDQQALHLLRMYSGFVFRDIDLCWSGLTKLLQITEKNKEIIRSDFNKMFLEFQSSTKLDINRPYRDSGSHFLLSLLKTLVKYKVNIPTSAALAFKTMATTNAVYTAVYPELTIKDMLPIVLDASKMFIYKLATQNPIFDLLEIQKNLPDFISNNFISNNIFEFLNLEELLKIDQQTLTKNLARQKQLLNALSMFENFWFALQNKEF